MLLFPSSILCSFLRAAAKRRAGEGHCRMLNAECRMEDGAAKRRAVLESAGRNGAAFVKKVSEKEGAPLGNREDAAVPADVPVHDLDAPGDVRVVLSVDQRAEGFAPGVLGLDLDGDEPVAATEEEVHFERGVLPLPPSRVRAGFDEGVFRVYTKHKPKSTGKSQNNSDHFYIPSHFMNDCFQAPEAPSRPSLTAGNGSSQLPLSA